MVRILRHPQRIRKYGHRQLHHCQLHHRQLPPCPPAALAAHGGDFSPTWPRPRTARSRPPRRPPPRHGAVTAICLDPGPVSRARTLTGGVRVNSNSDSKPPKKRNTSALKIAPPNDKAGVCFHAPPLSLAA